MKITIVNGSQRKKSESARVSAFISSKLNILYKEKIQTHILNLADEELEYWSDDNKESKAWNKISQELKSSDGFIFVVPEWHGMVPPKMKNLFMFAGNPEFAHKPCLLVSISSAMNGVYPIVELRAASSKNNHLVYIPNHLIIRDVNNQFNTHNIDDKKASKIEVRLEYSLAVLMEYCKAFLIVRESSIFNPQRFIYGM